MAIQSVIYVPTSPIAARTIARCLNNASCVFGTSSVMIAVAAKKHSAKSVRLTCAAALEADWQADSCMRCPLEGPHCPLKEGAQAAQDGHGSGPSPLHVLSGRG